MTTSQPFISHEFLTSVKNSNVQASARSLFTKIRAVLVSRGTSPAVIAKLSDRSILDRAIKAGIMNPTAHLLPLPDGSHIEWELFTGSEYVSVPVVYNKYIMSRAHYYELVKSLSS